MAVLDLEERIVDVFWLGPAALAIESVGGRLSWWLTSNVFALVGRWGVSRETSKPTGARRGGATYGAAQ